MLENRVSVLEEWAPSFGPEEVPPEYRRRGPAPKPPNAELFDRRNSYVLGLESVWPTFASQLFGAKTVTDLRRVLESFAPQMPIRRVLQEQFVQCSEALLDFIRSKRFRIKPSRRAVVLVLNWRDDDECYKAAAKLPTRQIANALAGVPELKWRRSLDRCVDFPCHLHVRRATEEYYRRLCEIE